MRFQAGYTLIELLVVTAIISVLAATVIPQFYPFKTRAYDTDAKANLHNIFHSCKGYWALTNGINPCALSTVSNNEYGFVQSSAVEITIGNGTNTESDFVASASHIWSSNVYAIDYRGAITNSSGSGGAQSAGVGGGATSKEQRKQARQAAREQRKKERQAAREQKKKEKQAAREQRKKEKQAAREKKKKEKQAAKEKKKQERQAKKSKK